MFSNYPANFSREHVAILRGLGDLVELAYARVSEKAVVPEVMADEELAAQASLEGLEDILPEPRTIDWLRDSQAQAREQKFPFWAVPVALIVILLSFRGWIAWHEPAKVPLTPPQAASEDLPDDAKHRAEAESGSRLPSSLGLLDRKALLKPPKHRKLWCETLLRRGSPGHREMVKARRKNPSNPLNCR